ncbi:hypothetical protein [Nitrincola sp. A-D6]|uniref:hypothetical protein n=1 Tax=Nitrincola sp. A-D6 TaxID=1545442 RepID=UPI000A8A1A8D
MAGFNSLGILRQLGLMIGLAASVAIGFAVVLWSQQPDYRMLYANLSFSDANEVIEQLRVNKIPYRFDADGRAILVPESHIHTARLQLAADGFTADKTIGFELLDQDHGMGSSQFMETTRYRRGLEGELARTISNMMAVRSAASIWLSPKIQYLYAISASSGIRVFGTHFWASVGAGPGSRYCQPCGVQYP